jgi:hypothetical protein
MSRAISPFGECRWLSNSGRGAARVKRAAQWKGRCNVIIDPERKLERSRVAAVLSAQTCAKGPRESARGGSAQSGHSIVDHVRDQIDYQEFCRRGQKESGAVCVGMLETGFGANRHRPID